MADSGESLDCLIPLEPPESVPRIQTTEGHLSYQSWIANDLAQQRLAAVLGALEDWFGSTSSLMDDPLAAGFIGTALDHTLQRLVVVVDQALVPQADDLQEDLNSVASRVAGEQEPFKVDVIEGCESASSLLHARKVLEARSWHEAALDSPIAYWLDPHDSTYHVTLPAGEAADALLLAVRTGITVEYGSPTLFSRANDAEPHYGGAGIHPASENVNKCTSLATVNLPGGGKGSVTAGHCMVLYGSHQLNDRDVESGSLHYGQSTGGHDYPQYDMVRIAPEGDSFDNKIWVDPCCPSIRTVTGAGNPQLHAFLCLSGAVTFAVCGADVTSLNVTYCPAPDLVCRAGVFRLHHDTNDIAQFGDSGGPVYDRLTATTAGIRGMILGGPCQTPCPTAFAVKWSVIRDHLNVTMAT